MSNNPEQNYTQLVTSLKSKETLLTDKNLHVINLAAKLEKLNKEEKILNLLKKDLEKVIEIKDSNWNSLINFILNNDRYKDFYKKFPTRESFLEYFKNIDIDDKLTEDRKKLLELIEKYEKSLDLYDKYETQIKTLENDAGQIINDLQSTYKNINKDENGWYCVLSLPPNLKIYNLQDLEKLTETYSKKARADFKDSLWDSEKAWIAEHITSKLDKGEPITKEEWLEFCNRGSGGDVQDVYNIMVEKWAKLNFKHNINTSINPLLVDIRNYHNFRQSNIGSDFMKINDNFSTINISTADSICASKSFYMSKNDFYWSLNFNNIKNKDGSLEPNSVQTIILNEYQPRVHYNLGVLLAASLDDLGGRVINKFSKSIKTNMKKKWGNKGENAASMLLNFGSQLAKAGAVKTYNDKLYTLSKDPSDLYNEVNDDATTNPMYFIEHMFSNGIWLNTYLLPFINKEKVLTNYLPEAKGGTWAVGGLLDAIENNGAMQKVLQGRISLSMPLSPVFLMNDASKNVYDPFSISFYLINKNDTQLDKNFQFIQALFAGTNWLTMDMGFIVATNVYNVYVPGRFMIHWAKLSMKVDAVGKLRKSDYMFAKYNNTDDDKSGIESIEEDTLWPLAWDITLNISPLSQWNFNTYIDYHKHGFGYRRKKRMFEMRGNVLDNLMSYDEIKKMDRTMYLDASSSKDALIGMIKEIERLLAEGKTSEAQAKVNQLHNRIKDLKEFINLIKEIDEDDSRNYEEEYGIALAESWLISKRTGKTPDEIAVEIKKIAERWDLPFDEILKRAINYKIASENGERSNLIIDFKFYKINTMDLNNLRYVLEHSSQYNKTLQNLEIDLENLEKSLNTKISLLETLNNTIDKNTEKAFKSKESIEEKVQRAFEREEFAKEQERLLQFQKEMEEFKRNHFKDEDLVVYMERTAKIVSEVDNIPFEEALNQIQEQYGDNPDTLKTLNNVYSDYQNKAEKQLKSTEKDVTYFEAQVLELSQKENISFNQALKKLQDQYGYNSEAFVILAQIDKAHENSYTGRLSYNEVNQELIILNAIALQDHTTIETVIKLRKNTYNNDTAYVALLESIEREILPSKSNLQKIDSNTASLTIKEYNSGHTLITFKLNNEEQKTLTFGGYLNKLNLNILKSLDFKNWYDSNISTVLLIYKNTDRDVNKLILGYKRVVTVKTVRKEN